MTTAPFRRTLGTLLIVTGAAAVSWSGLVNVRAQYVRWNYTRTSAAPAVEAPSPGTPIGLLMIPRLRLTSVVVEGDSPASLLVAAGHLPDTPFPWEMGNSAVAGHRDTDFRRLQDIRPGDTIRFAAPGAELSYVVHDTKVVEPVDISVLRPTKEPVLTLITCYPFGYVGGAPKRFVVRAARVAP